MGYGYGGFIDTFNSGGYGGNTTGNDVVGNLPGSPTGNSNISGGGSGGSSITGEGGVTFSPGGTVANVMNGPGIANTMFSGGLSSNYQALISGNSSALNNLGIGSATTDSSGNLTNVGNNNSSGGLLDGVTKMLSGVSSDTWAKMAMTAVAGLETASLTKSALAIQQQNANINQQNANTNSGLAASQEQTATNQEHAGSFNLGIIAKAQQQKDKQPKAIA